LPLREYLRILFMHVDQVIKPKEYVLYLKGESPNFFHYKKERLYDKTVIHTFIENSYFEAILNNGQEIAEPEETFKYLKNVLTQKDFESDIKYLYGFPIENQGVLMIHYDQLPLDPGADYSFYRMIALVIQSRISQEKSLHKIKKENQFYQKILNTPMIAYRIYKDYQVLYNERAVSLLQVDKHQHLELFLRDISYEYVKGYQDVINKLLSKAGTYEEVSYRYQEKMILEKMYSLRIGDETVIMSVFFDKTKEILEANNLQEKATLDFESGLPNHYQLKLDFDEHLNNKSSFILIELNDQFKQIYGSERMVQYFKEFGHISRKFFVDGKIYRYDYHQLMVIIPYNDIRTVTKSVKDYLKHLEQTQSNTLKYEKFDVNIGILRYPVVTTEQNSEKILRFLDIALEKAKRQLEEKFVFFVYRDYEDELFEQQVIDQLNVAIEEKALGLVFNQITDIKKNRVWQYESSLIIFNLVIESQYLVKIARKRNRLIDLEHYHIKKVCEFLVDLEKQTERLIKLTIPVSKETFLDTQFNAFFLGTLKQHGIPGEFIRIKFDMDIRANQYATQIKELIDFGISLDTTSIDMTLAYPFHALHLDYKKDSVKWNQYVVHIKTMLDQFQMALVIRNIKTKEQKEQMESLGIQYLEGPIYKEIPAPSLLQKIKETL
jgi:EAL domain-containing protein (putative c-di-GMP-specific phosphodiesterase class I)/GGDEF domain-containing protein